MKKLFSLAMVMIMALALCVPAFAAGTNSITVEGAQAEETYEIFKMLDLDVNDGRTAYSYTVNSSWTGFFTGSGAGAAYVNIDKGGYVTWKDNMKTAADMEAFGKAAAKFASDNGLESFVEAITPSEDGNIVFENLESGYYLITSTNGNLAMVDTTPTNPNATVEEKNPDGSLDKKVQEDSTEAWGKANSAQIGDTVEFKVDINVKKGAKNYVMHDKMEDGLTFNESSVEIDYLVKGTDYTVKTEGLTDGCTFEIHFAASYLDELAKDVTLTVTYDAVLNEKANVSSGEKNDAKLTWGDKSKTEWSETVTKTYQFEVLKYDANDSEKKPLAGAVFQLKDANDEVVKLIKVSDTEYRVANGDEDGAVDSFTTVDTDKIVIKGLDLDSYKLCETKAPAGYNKLNEDKTFAVVADSVLTVEIPNSTGTALPSTGGMGTTIFYTVGGILMAGAAILLITKKKMANEQ